MPLTFSRINTIPRFQVYGLTFQKHKALELTILMVVVLHWAACAEYYVSSIVLRAMIQDGKTHE